MAGNALELRGVHKSYGEVHVLKGVDLVVPEGTTCVVLGQSGSGKTVLLKIVAGLLAPDRGEVRVAGVDITQVDARGLVEVRKKVGILFQAGALFDSMSVWDNIAFPLRERLHLEEPEVQRRVEQALALVRLTGHGHKFPGELSGGMQKRAAFARAVVIEPPITLLDEPTAGLDPMTTEHITEQLVAAKKSLGGTTLAITYNLQSAFRIADHIAMLHEGRIVEYGETRAFLASHHPAVKAFLRDWTERERLKRARRPGGDAPSAP